MKTKYGLWPHIRLKEILEEKDFTQKEFAEIMGETPQQINRWVMGVEPCLSALGRMAITLGVTIEDLVWYAGDEPDFNANSKVFVRGEIVDTMGDLKNEQELLDKLKQHYRWTDEERRGVRIYSINFSKSEIVLKCADDTPCDEFITWAKKARNDMYRL